MQSDLIRYFVKSFGRGGDIILPFTFSIRGCDRQYFVPLCTSDQKNGVSISWWS